ncbi:probable sucrose-phosphatase 3b [Vigna radiata var. radiata]|uniref:Probable sucrose-phosphatase 3b n=1 Tax=Vigna radiata var. radiata TaxID=3916 RepID=A0A3Q0EU84_VIGRR|nr:probable sucrose-phosphatase 3b [Vigna radiata var. radiata]XP_022634019.1 probable sucrose-phosphatase 3b [Vigna radiata var. radiata]
MDNTIWVYSPHRKGAQYPNIPILDSYIYLMGEAANICLFHVHSKYLSLKFDSNCIYRHDSLLVFSIGRSPTVYGYSRKQKPLLTPNITIMFVGTENTYGESMVANDGWKQYLDHKWDRDVVLEETTKFPELTMQVLTAVRNRTTASQGQLLFGKREGPKCRQSSLNTFGETWVWANHGDGISILLKLLV